MTPAVAETHRRPNGPTATVVVVSAPVRQHRYAPPGGACQVLFVRHGESAPFDPAEPFPLVDGHGDPPLHSTGCAQADLIRDRLAPLGHQIAAIYVTSLTRTHQTAAPLADALGVTPQVEPDLREVFLGDWEGGYFREKVASADPVAVEMYRRQRWDVIPNGEPTEVFESRVRAGVERIAAAHRDELVVAVVHGGVIGQVFNIASGSTGFAFSGADNASINHVVVEPDRWVVRSFNDTSHL